MGVLKDTRHRDTDSTYEHKVERDTKLHRQFYDKDKASQIAPIRQLDPKTLELLSEKKLTDQEKAKIFARKYPRSHFMRNISRLRYKLTQKQIETVFKLHKKWAKST